MKQEVNWDKLMNCAEDIAQYFCKHELKCGEAERLLRVLLMDIWKRYNAPRANVKEAIDELGKLMDEYYETLPS